MGEWYFLFIIQMVRHFQLQLIAQLLSPPPPPLLQDLYTGGAAQEKGLGHLQFPEAQYWEQQLPLDARTLLFLAGILYMSVVPVQGTVSSPTGVDLFFSNTSDCHTFGLDLSLTLN